MTNCPKIRNIEPVPVMVRGEQMIALRDPHNLAEKDSMVIMSLQAFQIAALFDGTISISDIQNFLTRAGGGVLFDSEILYNIVQTLDENYLLENERTDAVLKNYRKQNIRKSILAGRNIPKEKDQLTKYLNDVMAKTPPCSPGKCYGFLAPHIDIDRGKESFAKAYRNLSREEKNKIYVIFGTSHYAPPKTRFIFSEKCYQTPLGTMETDTDFVRKVVAKVNHDLFREEIVHKGEHSIEFQVLFLQHILGENTDAKIVPILVGSFHDCMQQGLSPEECPEIKNTLQAIEEVAEEIGRDRVCWIASGDLSHVGQRFGDASAPDDSLLETIKNVDMQSLEATANCLPDQFYHNLAQNDNQYRTCGLSPIYSLLTMLKDNARGELQSYQQSLEPETGSVVTFATVKFYPAILE